MSRIFASSLVLAFAVLGASCRGGVARETEAVDPHAFEDTFSGNASDLGPTGRNRFFILEPGYVLEFQSDDGREALVITVTDETKLVGDVETRVVEERETLDGKVKEVSRNYFAISGTTFDVFYFGEDAGGAWRDGENGARFGLMMPGTPVVGARFYEELAPGRAMDRAEIVSVSGRTTTPAGTFDGVLIVEETTPLEPNEKARKYYAPAVGLLQDGACRLVRYGFREPGR